MHDAKFAYTLTQHAGCSFLKSSYILCGCNKGEAVGNNKYVCKLATDLEQLLLYNASAKKWATITTHTSDPKLQKKEKEKHKKWIQWHNKGITHFGLHPSLLPLSAIQCDVFHMGCLVGRRLIDYLRDFLILQRYDL